MKKKILLVVLILIVGLSVGAAVFFALVPHYDYAGARTKVVEILGTRGAVEKLLDAKEISSEADEAQKGIMANFGEALEKNEKLFGELSEADIQKDKEVEQRFKAAKTSYEKIEKLGRIWTDVKRFETLTDDDLIELKKSDSSSIREIADGLVALRKKLKDYHEKYDNAKQGSSELIVDYSGIWLEAAALEEKAQKMSLDDILGMSRDDILEFYAKMEELDNYISEKK